MSIGLLGQKIGMTSVYDANGRLRPVTVIAAGDNVLLRRLTSENEGYSAVQVGFDVQKESRVTKQLLGEFKKAGSEPKKFVREFRLSADLPQGDVDLNVTQFQPGDYVDVTGRSKGKGFQGVMKRHHFRGGEGSHGSMFHRAPGGIGGSSFPSRVWKNQHFPGHMGNAKVTAKNLKVIKVDTDENLLLVRGSVPGPAGQYIFIKKARKAK